MSCGNWGFNLFGQVWGLILRRNSGPELAGRRRLNLVEGANVSLAVADSPAQNEVTVTASVAALPAAVITSGLLAPARGGTGGDLSGFTAGDVLFVTSGGVVTHDAGNLKYASGTLTAPALAVPNGAANLTLAPRAGVAGQWGFGSGSTLLSVNWYVTAAVSPALAQFVVFDRDPAATGNQCFGRFQVDTGGNLRIDLNAAGTATRGSIYVGLDGNDAWRVWFSGGQTRLEGGSNAAIYLDATSGVSLTVSSTTDSTSLATGCVVLSGGLAVGKSLFVGGPALDLGNAAWVRNDPGTSRLTANVTNATTTLSNLSDLSQTVVAGRKYTGRLVLKCNNSTATGGVKIDFGGGTATMTSFWAVAQPAGTAGSGGTIATGTLVSTTLAGAVNYTTITGETLITVEVSFVVSAGGTLIPRVATNSAGTVTAELGSSLRLWDSRN